VGKDREGNHFQLMEDIHQDMKDVVVSRFAYALAEVGEGSFGGNVFCNAGNAPVFAAPLLVPERCDKGVHVRIAVNMPEQIQGKKRHRVIAGRPEDAVGVGGHGADEGKVDQGCDQT
jgi:hypothetical protein